MQITGSIPNSEMFGNEMECQETYRLNADGIFLKSRDRDGVVTEVLGMYNLINNSNEPLLELIFDSDIVGSCTYKNIETMSLQSKTILLSTLNTCDGPGLKYEKED